MGCNWFIPTLVPLLCTWLTEYVSLGLYRYFSTQKLVSGNSAFIEVLHTQRVSVFFLILLMSAFSCLPSFFETLMIEIIQNFVPGMYQLSSDSCVMVVTYVTLSLLLKLSLYLSSQPFFRVPKGLETYIAFASCTQAICVNFLVNVCQVSESRLEFWFS